VKVDENGVGLHRDYGGERAGAGRRGEGEREEKEYGEASREENETREKREGVVTSKKR